MNEAYYDRLVKLGCETLAPISENDALRLILHAAYGMTKNQLVGNPDVFGKEEVLAVIGKKKWMANEADEFAKEVLGKLRAFDSSIIPSRAEYVTAVLKFLGDSKHRNWIGRLPWIEQYEYGIEAAFLRDKNESSDHTLKELVARWVYKAAWGDESYSPSQTTIDKLISSLFYCSRQHQLHSHGGRMPPSSPWAKSTRFSARELEESFEFSTLHERPWGFSNLLRQTRTTKCLKT
jgi:hypothetical protein